MELDKPQTGKKARLFKNPILESLTKTTPLLSLLFYLPIVALLLYVALIHAELSISTVALWFVFAFFFWTLAEYLLHRYLFHWVTESETVRRMHYLMHGVHHDYPTDTDRLLMPPAPGLILASLLFGITYVVFYILGFAHLSWAFFAGFFFGYLMYSFIHYSIHKFKPPTFLKSIWIHHHLHHHRYPDRAFGVSTLFWDRIFNSLPPENARGKKTVEKH